MKASEQINELIGKLKCCGNCVSIGKDGNYCKLYGVPVNARNVCPGWKTKMSNEKMLNAIFSNVNDADMMRNCANCKHSWMYGCSPTEDCGSCQRHRCNCEIDNREHSWSSVCESWVFFNKNQSNE